MSKLIRWLPLGRVPEINAQALHKALGSSKPPRIIDVRTASEWEKSRISNAVSVPITELAGQISNLPFDRNEPIVAICLSAHRSIPAVRLLREAGYKDVHQLRGGMLSWWKAGLPTNKQHRQTISSSR